MRRMWFHRPAGLPHLSLKAWDTMVTLTSHLPPEPAQGTLRRCTCKRSFCTYLQGLCLGSSSQNQSYDTEQQTYSALPTQMPFITWTAHPFRKEPLTGSTKSQFVGTLHSHLRQKLETTGCNWSCQVEGPEKLLLQKLPRYPQGPFTPCLPNRNTLPCAGERMLTAF